jgi:hypothetical protein
VSRRCRPELRVPVGKITHLRGCFQCCVAGRWCSVGYLQLCLQRHVRPFARLHCSYHPLTGDSPALLVLSHLAHRRLANLPRPHCLYLTTDSPLWGGFVTSPSPLSMWWFRPLSWAVVYVSFFFPSCFFLSLPIPLSEVDSSPAHLPSCTLCQCGGFVPAQVVW